MKNLLYNVELGKQLSPIASILFSVLFERAEQCALNNDLINVNEKICFYCPRQLIEEETGISAHQQRAAMKLLESHGILEVYENIGVPAKNYYHLNKAAFDLFDSAFNDFMRYKMHTHSQRQLFLCETKKFKNTKK